MTDPNSSSNQIFKPRTIDQDGVNERNKLGSLGYKIFLDRYAYKDASKKTVKKGDLVIVCVNLETSQREIGEVLNFDQITKQVQIKLTEQNEVITRHLDQIDKPLETKPSEMLDRVAQGLAKTEKTKELQKEWQEKFRWALDGWKFIPAGRILTAAGTDQNLTFYNCYVIPNPKDARAEIFNSIKTMAEILSRGGGVGVNLSSLRPRYAYVKGVNGRSSGSVSWGSIYSFVTGLMEQGGSRRGALMLILNDWHPDILEFIEAKTGSGKITNANISVGISDRFMAAVEADEDWVLEFPDTTYPDYNQTWNGSLEDWKAANKPVLEYKKMPAKEIWQKIIKSAWTSAEPGIWFRDRSNQFSNSWYYDKLICTNPCGEQPLPAWGVCNLGAINLSKFVQNNQVNWDNLKTTIHYAVRFLDNAIDTTLYFFEENAAQQKKERRVGLNTMGLAEMMIRLGIIYGSEESLEFIDELYEFIVRETYQASTNLAQEKGSFPVYDRDRFLESGYIQNLPTDIQEMVRNKGIRNVTLLTQAPNGTIGTMTGTSTGIEPFYSWVYFRKTRIGIHEERVAVVEEWLKDNPDKTFEDLPDYFTNAMELTPEQHVKVQARVQRWVDSAISKTCNVPENYTIEETAALYSLMHQLNCKGGTIYRDKSRDQQVLMLADDERAKIAMENKIADQNQPNLNQLPIEQPKLRPHPSRRQGVTISKSTPIGTAHIVMNNDAEDNPLEIFVTVGKAGSDTTAMAEALGRIMSLVLRLNSPLTPIERIEAMANQIKGIGGSRSIGFGRNKISSLPDAVAQALEENYLIKDEETEESEEDKLSQEEQLTLVEQSVKTKAADLCPHCGQASFVKTESCHSCFSCGYSLC